MRTIRSNKVILLFLLLSFPTTILFGIISTKVHAADEDIPDENYKNEWHWHTDIQTDELIIYEMEMTQRNLTSGKMTLMTKELRIINITGFKNETWNYGFGNVSRIYGSLCYYNCTSDEIKTYQYLSDRSIAGFGYNDTGVFREYYDMGDDAPSLGCTFLPVNGTKGVATVEVDIMADIINRTYLPIIYQKGWAPKFNYYETDPIKNSIYFLNTTNNYFINNTYYDNGTLRNAEASYWLVYGTNPSPMEFNVTMKHVLNYDITDEVEWGVDVGDSLYYGWNSHYSGYNETKFVITGFENVVNEVKGSFSPFMPIHQCFETVLANLSYWDPALGDYTFAKENYTIGVANNYHPLIFGSEYPLLTPKNTDIKDIDFFFNNDTNEVHGTGFPFDEVRTKFENGKNKLICSHSIEDATLKLIYNKTTGICDLLFVENMGYKQAIYRKNMTTITDQGEADSILLYSDLVGNNWIYMNFTYIPGEDFDLYWATLPVNPTLVEFEYEIYYMPLYVDVYMNNSNYQYPSGPINVTLYYDDSLLSADMEENLATYYCDIINEEWIEVPEIQVTLDTDANMIVVVGLEYVDFTFPQYFALGIKEWTWGVDVNDILPYELDAEGYDINTGDLLGAFLDFWIFNITSIEDKTHDWHYEPDQTFSQVNFTWMYYNHSLGRLAWNPNSPFGDPSPLMEFCDNRSSMVPLKFGDQNPTCLRVPFILPLTYGKLNLTILAPILNETFFAISDISKWDYYYTDDVANTLFFFNSTYGHFMDLTYFENGTLKEAKTFIIQEGSAIYNATITRKTSWNVTSEVEWSVKPGDELYFGDMDKEFKYHIVEINETAVNLGDMGVIPYPSIQSFSYVVGDIYHWNSTHEYWMFQYTGLISAANNLYPIGLYYYIAYTLGLTPTWPSLLMPIGIDEYMMLDAMKLHMGGMKVDTISEIGKYYIHFTNSTGPHHMYMNWDNSTGVIKLMYGFSYYPGKDWTDFVFFAKKRTDLELDNNIIELDNYFVPDIILTMNITTTEAGCEFYSAILDVNPTNQSLPGGTGTPLFFGDMMINNHTKVAGNFTIEVKLLGIDLDDITLHLSGWYPSIGDWQILPEEMMNQMVTYNYSGNSIIAEMTGDPYFCAIGAWSYTFKSPGAFNLSSTAEGPDDDGIFTLTWDVSPLANNYSVYEYHSYITVINGSLTSLATNIPSLFLPLNGYTDGTYYFIIEAHNEYGDTLSNCIEVLVEIGQPPGSFVLNSTAGDPDDDGIFTLTWDTAPDAEDYSVYEYSSYITIVNGSLTSLATDITNLSLTLTGYSTGTYYFIVEAHNEYGDTLSNCIEVVVEIPNPPGNFILSSNAGSPDDDGIFTLSWGASNGAVSYSIYEYFSYITVINGSLTSLATDITSLSHSLTGYTNGTYYFIVVAHNADGDTLSNCHAVAVEIPPEEPDDGNGGDGGGIPGYPLYVLLTCFIVITAIMIRKMREKLPKF